MKLAVFLPNWIGDIVMATPALRALRKHFGPNDLFIGVMRPYVSEVLMGTTWLNKVIYYDPSSQDKHLRSRELIRQLRSHGVDMSILLTNSMRTGLLALAGGAKMRVGFAKNGRGLLLTDTLTHPKVSGRKVQTSALDDYLQLAALVGCTGKQKRLELATVKEDEKAADHVWHKLGLPPGDRVIIFHNGGGWGGAASAKAWPGEYFAELARRIATERELSVLVICGPAEKQIAAKIVHEADHPAVVGLTEEKLSIGLSKACIRRSRLMVSTDSGPRHFAAAFDVPLITLYGSTDPAKSLNYHPRETPLQLRVPCGPCAERVCPYEHHSCMRELSVTSVFAAVEQKLNESDHRFGVDAEAP